MHLLPDVQSHTLSIHSVFFFVNMIYISRQVLLLLFLLLQIPYSSLLIHSLWPISLVSPQPISPHCPTQTSMIFFFWHAKAFILCSSKWAPNFLWWYQLLSHLLSLFPQLDCKFGILSSQWVIQHNLSVHWSSILYYLLTDPLIDSKGRKLEQ